jgi:protein-tyrosine phosphatase
MLWSRAATSHIPNFRDVGGHRTRDGRRVRSGLLYRSVDLASLDEERLDWLAGLGLRTVFDLRTAPERARRPSRAPGTARLVVLDVLADSGQADPAAFYELMRDPPRASAHLADGASERFFVTTYRDLVTLPSARGAFGRFYRGLAVADGRPALVHCTTGKDRTGWAVAALLGFLGVPAETVMADYLRSDAEIRAAFGFIVDDFVAQGGERSVIEPIISARQVYLEAAQDEVARRHGSLEGYLRDGLGLGPEVLDALRDGFLEPAEA